MKFSKGKPRSYSHIKKGYREDLGMNFRSAMEANFARHLNFLKNNLQIIGWQYEPLKFWFPLAGATNSYTPDFVVLEECSRKVFKDKWTTELDYPLKWYEIKGYMSAKDKTKLSRMKRYYPKIRIEVVDSKAYKAIIKSLKGLVEFE